MKKWVRGEKAFKKLLKKNMYQVFLFESKLYYPLRFAVHTWFVINEKGKIKRWEILENHNSVKKSLGYMHLNIAKPTLGVERHKHKDYPRNKSYLIGYLEGKRGSTAQRIATFLDEKASKYPLRFVYHYFPGPNSNTFPQWVIDKFPESDLKMPFNAFGKRYPVKGSL